MTMMVSFVSSFGSGLCKVSAYYHGHTPDQLQEILKKGLPKGSYVARRRWISDLYGGQYPGGGVVKIHIPKDRRTEFLRQDEANTLGTLNSAMRRNKAVMKDIPPEWIKGPMRVDPAKVEARQTRLADEVITKIKRGGQGPGFSAVRAHLSKV